MTKNICKLTHRRPDAIAANGDRRGEEKSSNRYVEMCDTVAAAASNAIALRLKYDASFSSPRCPPSIDF